MEGMMSDKSLEEKIEELYAITAAITAFVTEIPDAAHVEMPKIKAAIQANKALTENQKKIATDAAREIKHAVQAKGGDEH
jgi:hypothetical protein